MGKSVKTELGARLDWLKEPRANRFEPLGIAALRVIEDSHRASEGIEYVLAAGLMVVRDGELVRGLYPGEPIVASGHAGGPGTGSGN